MSTVNERIKIIVDIIYNGNVLEFERACSLKKDTLKHVVAGRMSKPSFDTIEAIVRTVVRISPLWLITGSGKMEIDDSLNNDSLVEGLKAEINMLKGENRVLREQVGLGERKDDSESA